MHEAIRKIGHQEMKLKPSMRIFRRTDAYVRRCHSLVESFEQICFQRRSDIKFSNEEIAPSVLRNILRLTQSSPSSFNLQPYKIIVVDDSHRRECIATAMLGGNAKKVLSAPVTFVFASYRGKCISLYV